MLKPLSANFETYIVLRNIPLQTYFSANGDKTAFFTITARQLLSSIFETHLAYQPKKMSDAYDTLDRYIAYKCCTRLGTQQLLHITGDMYVDHDVKIIHVSATDAMAFIGKHLGFHTDVPNKRIAYSDAPTPALERQRLVHDHWNTIDVVSTDANDIEAYHAFCLLFKILTPKEL